jgi:hypothetical protein
MLPPNYAELTSTWISAASGGFGPGMRLTHARTRAISSRAFSARMARSELLVLDVQPFFNAEHVVGGEKNRWATNVGSIAERMTTVTRIENCSWLMIPALSR